MKRAILTALLLTILVPCLNAQKKELSQARTYIKSGKDYDKAEQLMTRLLDDDANRNDIKIRMTLAEAVRKQYDEINQKMYLGEKYDTVSLFNLTRKMFMAYEGIDSVDALPDANGKVKPKLRKKNAEYISVLRPNLFNGGIYFMRKQQYETAYGFMETYIDCDRQPLFTGIDNGDKVKDAAYWSLFCGYKMGNADKTLRYAAVAETDTSRLDRTCRYLAETYQNAGDTLNYISYLRKGFARYKSDHFFYTRLVDYYNSRSQTDSALAVVDDALAVCPDDELLLFAKSSILLNAGDYEGCVTLCDRLIAINDSFADAHYNAGVAYLNKAFRMERRAKSSATAYAQIKEIYAKARPYMERYRALRPDDKDKWAAALYNIYLRLNMGKEFEEIDRLLR